MKPWLRVEMLMEIKHARRLHIKNRKLTCIIFKNFLYHIIKDLVVIVKHLVIFSFFTSFTANQHYSLFVSDYITCVDNQECGTILHFECDFLCSSHKVGANWSLYLVIPSFLILIVETQIKPSIITIITTKVPNFTILINSWYYIITAIHAVWFKLDLIIIVIKNVEFIQGALLRVCPSSNSWMPIFASHLIFQDPRDNYICVIRCSNSCKNCPLFLTIYVFAKLMYSFDCRAIWKLVSANQLKVFVFPIVNLTIFSANCKIPVLPWNKIWYTFDCTNARTAQTHLSKWQLVWFLRVSMSYEKSSWLG